MTIDDRLWFLHTRVIPDALALLPGQMTSPEARAMLLAIGLQESHFDARRQHGNGPARGWWQFERAGGVAEILEHPATGPIITPICDLLLYPATAAACHAALEHNDILAACFARLLLWVDPRPMPGSTQAPKGWAIYLNNWRPGAPHPQTWPANFAKAWAVVEGEQS